MYSAIIDRLFQERWVPGCPQVDFHRSDIEAEAAALGVKLPKNQQDVSFCAERFPALTCRPVAAQSLANDVIALFERVLQDEQLRVRQERHYRWVKTNVYAPPRR